jgi:hypothetical protein
MQHLLLTVPADAGDLHAYVICKKQGQQDTIQRVLSYMFDLIGKLGVKTPNVSLITTMDDEATRTVEDFLNENFPETVAKRKDAKDFHCCVWAMDKDVEWIRDIH